MLPRKLNTLQSASKAQLSIDKITNPLVIKYLRDYDSRIGKVPTKVITLGVDSEYKSISDRANLMIVSQVGFSSDPDECLVFEHPDLASNLDADRSFDPMGLRNYIDCSLESYSPLLPSWDGDCLFSSLVGWSEVEACQHNAVLILEMICFWSPSDVLRGQFSPDVCRYIQKYLTQSGRLKVESGDRQNPDVLLLPIFLSSPVGIIRLALKIVDLSRISVGGLEKTCLSFGLQMKSKGLMDEYKHNMLVPYFDPLKRPKLIEYAKEDVTVLFELREKNREREEKLYHVHNLIPDGKERLTVGKTIENMFVNWVEDYIGDYPAYKFFQSKNLKGDFKEYTLRDLLKDSCLNHYAELKGTTEAVLSMVSGGMAKNLRPTDFKVEGAIADADFKSGYVSIQMTLDYPIGIPSRWYTDKSSKQKMTLGQFLKQYGGELGDRLFTVVVSGTLGHHQSLVPSKVIDSIAVAEKYDPDRAKIPAEFRYYSKEIINGVITSDIIQVLRNVCTDREWSQWEKLDVVSACWYSNSYRCETPEEWYQKTQEYVAKNGNEISTVMVKGKPVLVDKRSYYWLAVPIKLFLLPYADERDQLKVKMKMEIQGSSEHALLNAQQEAMKLSGNTLYGDFASLAMDASNPVTPNVITAMMRSAVWCGAMAAGGYEVITDGFSYELNAVRVWNGSKKPSMNTLSLWRDLDLINRETRRSLGTQPLGNQGRWSLAPGKQEGDDRYTILSNASVSWERKKETWSELNEMLKQHVIDFFRKDGYEIQCLSEMNFEHKDVFAKALFHGQTNYQLHSADGAVQTKARGYLIDKGLVYNQETEEARIVDLFRDLDQNPTAIPPYKPQRYSEVGKVDEMNRMLNAAGDNVVKENKLIAGDSFGKTTWLRPISLSSFCWQTHSQHTSWVKTSDHLKSISGYGIEQYFLNDDGTLNYPLALQKIQKAIDEGKDWIVPFGAKGKSKYKPKSTHPYYGVVEAEVPDVIETDLIID